MEPKCIVCDIEYDDDFILGKFCSSFCCDIHNIMQDGYSKSEAKRILRDPMHSHEED